MRHAATRRSSGRFPALPAPALVAAVALVAALVAALPSARAQDAPACVKQGTEPRAYLDCLSRQQKLSEQRLAHAIAAAQAKIEGRQELQPPQRKRWTTLFTESQSRFTGWRDFECQSIAPYEGGAGAKTVGGRLGGATVIEQRLNCVTRLNDERSADLERRYELPAFVPSAEPEPTPGGTAAGTAPAGQAAAPSPAAPSSPPAAAPAPEMEPPSGPVRIIQP